MNAPATAEQGLTFPSLSSFKNKSLHLLINY
jgi:hypothetical protein